MRHDSGTSHASRATASRALWGPDASATVGMCVTGSMTVLRAEGRVIEQAPAAGRGLDEVERELIRRALGKFDGNVSRAAKFLKVSRQTLIYRIKKHELG